jgi:hypothetical protein
VDDNISPTQAEQATGTQRSNGQGPDANRVRQAIRDLFPGPPLPLSVTAVPPFPVDVLPPVLADMAAGVADALGVDPAMPAVFGLGAVSAALCGRVQVAVVPGGWTENGVTWTVVVADTGDAKTPAMAAMLTDPLMAVQQRLIAEHTATEHEQVAEETPDGDGVEVVGEQPAGPWPQLIVTDTTIEAAGMLMGEQRGNIALVDAEGDVFEHLSGRYARNGTPPSLNLYVRAYSGEAFHERRVSRAPVSLARPALTLCLATQPVVWHPVMANERFAGKGFVARLSVAFPEARLKRAERLGTLGTVNDAPPVGVAVRTAYTRMLHETVLGLWEREVAGVTAELTTAATRRVLAYRADIDLRRHDGDLAGRLSPWAAKSPGRVARWALHLHLAGLIAEKTRPELAAGRLIEADTVERAIVIEEWFTANAREAFGVAATTGVNLDDAERVVGWLIRDHAKRPYEPITREHMAQSGPPCIARASQLHPMVELLVDLRYLVETVVGERKQAVYLHPDALPE